MSDKERRYLRWLSDVVSGKTSLAAAAEGMGVSYRQARRLLKSYRAEGDSGLVHGLRGKASTRKAPEETKAATLARYRERYSDFGPTLAAEHLSANDNLPTNHETLRLWLMEAGLWKARASKKVHRSWRKRRARFGQMLQIDGSIHLWFEDRGPQCFLMSAVDDATGRCHLLFTEQETTWAALNLLDGWTARYGCPQSVYVDRKSVYISDRDQTPDEQLADKPALTQFGNACHKLGIRVIAAHSPQAKGRVERKHAVCQDRLIKEMRLAGVSSIESANAFLAGWIDPFNEKFSVVASEEEEGHRPFPEGVNRQSVFCLEETRSVGKDWTVRHDNVWYQILKDKNLPLAGDKVTVQTARDGQVSIIGRHGLLTILRLDKAPVKTVVNRAATVPRVPHKPAPDHPWRGEARGEAVGDAVMRRGTPRATPREIAALAEQYLGTPQPLQISPHTNAPPVLL